MGGGRGGGRSSWHAAERGGVDGIGDAAVRNGQAVGGARPGAAGGSRRCRPRTVVGGEPGPRGAGACTPWPPGGGRENRGRVPAAGEPRAERVREADRVPPACGGTGAERARHEKGARRAAASRSVDAQV